MTTETKTINGRNVSAEIPVILIGSNFFLWTMNFIQNESMEASVYIGFLVTLYFITSVIATPMSYANRIYSFLIFFVINLIGSILLFIIFNAELSDVFYTVIILNLGLFVLSFVFTLIMDWIGKER